MYCLAGEMHKNEQSAAFGVQLGRPSLRNELVFADRQAQSDGVTLRGSEGNFRLFSCGLNHMCGKGARAFKHCGLRRKAAV